AVNESHRGRAQDPAMRSCVQVVSLTAGFDAVMLSARPCGLHGTARESHWPSSVRWIRNRFARTVRPPGPGAKAADEHGSVVAPFQFASPCLWWFPRTYRIAYATSRGLFRAREW